MASPGAGVANDLGGKADFCSGQDFGIWLSYRTIDKIMVTDGPHGLRK